MNARKKIISLILVVAILLGVVVVDMRGVVRAEEEGPAVEIVNGASVRISDLSGKSSAGNGLRFSIMMDQTAYNDFVADSAYTDVVFGILIAPDTDAYQLTKESVFGTSTEKKYDWATWNATTKKWEYEASDYTRIMNFEATGLYLARENEDQSKVYYRASITDIKEENIAKNFQAIGYVRYTKDNHTTYQLTDKVSRSMALVAQKAMADESASAPTAEEKEWLQKTYLDKIKDMEASYTTEYYKETATLGEYELYKTERKTAKINTEITLEDIELPGYACDTSKDNVTSGRVWVDGSLALKKYYKDTEDNTNNQKVDYIWGGDANTATISQNTDAEGLCGEYSVRSIKIEDKDITGFNDYAVKIPTDRYAAFSADIKVVLNTTSNITKDLPMTNSSGKYIGAIELGKWQKVYASGGDWIVTFAFPELLGGSTNPSGTATIYLDNIVFYTQEEVDNGSWNPTCWVENSIGTGDGDAVADMESKFDITLSTTGSIYKNYKNRYLIQTVASSANGSHMIKVKAPNVADISECGGISFAIDMQINGGAAGGSIPLYLVKKGVTYTAGELTSLSNFSDTSIFTKIHAYQVDVVGGTFNGSEIVTISTEQLKKAGYDLSNLNDLTFVFRDVELTGGWWNVLNLYFYDFEVVFDKVFVETDDNTNNQIVDYIWGGSANTATISQNTDAEGLCGEDSVQSIKIEDKDITGYNDYTIKIPTGYVAASADIKVILNTTSSITKDLPMTNSSGKYIGAIELGKWQKLWYTSGDTLVTFVFPELIGGSTNPSGTATIYLDNIAFYTQEEVDNGSWNPTCWVANSIGTSDGDAVADMESKFDITFGGAGTSYTNAKNRYAMQKVADTLNGSHLIKVKAPKVTDVSGYTSVSFTIDMKMRGGAAGGSIPLYLVKKGVTYTADALTSLSDFSDTTTFTRIHDYQVDVVGDIYNGSEIVTITTAQLEAAGYDLSNLNDLTFAFRDVELPVAGGWYNVLGLYFYDFKLN